MTQDQLDDIIEDIMTSTWDSGKTKILNFARLMCDKQKEICLNQYDELQENATHVIYIRNGIVNSPYPDGL